MNNNEIYQYIGTQIRARRKALDFTQEELSKQLGMSRAALANIETGRQNILVHQLYRFAKILNLLPADLLPAFKEFSLKEDGTSLPLPENLKPKQKEQISRLILSEDYKN